MNTFVQKVSSYSLLWRTANYKLTLIYKKLSGLIASGFDTLRFADAKLLFSLGVAITLFGAAAPMTIWSIQLSQRNLDELTQTTAQIDLLQHVGADIDRLDRLKQRYLQTGEVEDFKYVSSLRTRSNTSLAQLELQRRDRTRAALQRLPMKTRSTSVPPLAFPPIGLAQEITANQKIIKEQLRSDGFTLASLRGRVTDVHERSTTLLGEQLLQNRKLQNYLIMQASVVVGSSSFLFILLFWMLRPQHKGAAHSQRNLGCCRDGH